MPLLRFVGSVGTDAPLALRQLQAACGVTLAIGSNFSKPWRTPVRTSQDAALRAKTRERIDARRGSVRPMMALASEYRRQLLGLIDGMSEAVLSEIGRAYSDQDDKIAMISGDGLAYDGRSVYNKLPDDDRLSLCVGDL